MKLSKKEIKNAKDLIQSAFKEDRVFQDATAKLFIPKNIQAEGILLAKESGVLSGAEIAKLVFRMFDKKLSVMIRIQDGTSIRKGDIVLTVRGSLRSILSAERTVLNFLGHLSGITTSTSRFVKQAGSKKIKIMDTRKTTPGFRYLEKYAVRAGGGCNHRLSLEGSVFIKDNHWKYRDPKNWQKALERVKKTKKELIVEIENETQLNQALKLKPNVLLLDNVSPAQIKVFKKKIQNLKKKPALEASGGVTFKNIKAYAASGVDRISVGALTHSAVNLDFSLEIR